MSRSVGQTDIIAKAMILIGDAGRLTSIDAPGPKAANLRSLWTIALPVALATYPWNFATRRCWLNADPERPAFGYSHRFRKPADCVRWLPPALGEEHYFEGEEEESYILANPCRRWIHDINANEGLRLPFRYTALITDVAAWSPLFDEVIAYTLAMEHCQSVAQLRGLTGDLRAGREEVIAGARRADGLSTGRRQRSRLPATSRWASARFRSNGYGPR